MATKDEKITRIQGVIKPLPIDINRMSQSNQNEIQRQLDILRHWKEEIKLEMPHLHEQQN